MTTKGTLLAIIDLEELNKVTATTRNLLLSAKKVFAADKVGSEHVTQLMTAVRDKFSWMIRLVQHYYLLQPGG